MAQLTNGEKHEIEIYTETYRALSDNLSKYGNKYSDFFTSVLEEGDLELMNEIMFMLPEGYWKFEFCRQIRYREDELKNNE